MLTVPEPVIVPPVNGELNTILVTVPALEVKPDGLVELYGVKPNPPVTFPDVRDKVPARVKLPVVFTVPLKDMPLTAPVPLTSVTVPVELVLLLKVFQSVVVK